MKELIDEIRSEMENISPKHLKLTKKRYATKKEIADFEEQCQLNLPADLVEFWLTCDFEITLSTKIYKTLICDDGPSFFMMEEFEYLGKYWKENAGHGFDEGFSKSDYFNFEDRGLKEKILTNRVFDNGWFPFAIDSYDGAICIDLNPGPNGTHGQLLYMMYTGDGKSGPYYAGYHSFKEFLQNYLQLLRDRNIEIEENIIYPLSSF
jgi:cell wall assembly regulator SMI1